MKRFPRKWVRRGVAAVEMAVLAPFLVFLFMIVTDFARVFFYQVTLDDCARNGALLGSSLYSYQETGWVKPYNDIVTATVADGASLNPPLDPSQVTVTNGTGSDGNPNITVTIQYPFKSISNFPGHGSLLNLEATVSMRVAPPPKAPATN
jgi:Flp pilus assembly protein TadG